tara:strand:- start:66 stop:281 length:216 start_codon:yes stop_codon:yes gene_type:complete
VVEFEGIGPCPLTGMMLADMGASVMMVGRKQSNLTLQKSPQKKLLMAFFTEASVQFNWTLIKPRVWNWQGN